MKDILLSPKHGVNPAIPLCFYCGKEKPEVILAGRLKGDVEAPRAVVWDRRPCPACLDHMKQGVILISVKDGPEEQNPYRTGGWIVVKEEAVRRVFGDDAPALRSRVAFVTDAAWAQLGLPR